MNSEIIILIQFNQNVTSIQRTRSDAQSRQPLVPVVKRSFVVQKLSISRLSKIRHLSALKWSGNNIYSVSFVYALMDHIDELNRYTG